MGEKRDERRVKGGGGKKEGDQTSKKCLEYYFESENI